MPKYHVTGIWPLCALPDKEGASRPISFMHSEVYIAPSADRAAEGYKQNLSPVEIRPGHFLNRLGTVMLMVTEVEESERETSEKD